MGDEGAAQERLLYAGLSIAAAVPIAGYAAAGGQALKYTGKTAGFVASNKALRNTTIVGGTLIGSGLYSQEAQAGLPTKFLKEISEAGFKSQDEFGAFISRRYQRLVDDAYTQVTRRINSGKLIPREGIPLNTFIGQQVDRQSRGALRLQLKTLAITDSATSLARVNRRLYNAAGDAYRVPDLYLPSVNRIFDLTVGTKTILTPQVIDFYRFSQGARITIVQPTRLGGAFDLIL